MRRFFISGFERLLAVLTILSVLAVAALAARIAVEAQPGETRQYLTAAAILVGGWLAVVAVAGVSFLAIAMHDNSRRLIGLMVQGGRGARPLTATRQPERASVKRSPVKASATPRPEAEPVLWQEDDDLVDAADNPGPERATTIAQPQAAARPVFSGRAMPRVQTDPAAEMQPEFSAEPAPAIQPTARPAPTAVAQKAPVEPAPPVNSASRAPRLVADRRFPR